MVVVPSELQCRRRRRIIRLEHTVVVTAVYEADSVTQLVAGRRYLIDLVIGTEIAAISNLTLY